MARGVRRRLMQAWWRASRPMTLGVRGVVRDSSGAILLVRHTYTPGWHFPGGGVERGETAPQALAKELEEEAGVRITAPPRLLGVYANFRSFPGDHVLLFDAPSWIATPAASKGEIAEIGFFAPNAPPLDVTPGTLRRLREILGEAEQSAAW